MKLAILGFGEAASTIAGGLSGRGPAQVRVWKRQPWTDATRSNADAVGVVLCAEATEAVDPADIVFSLVPPGAAVEVAERAAATCRGKLYVDLNATALRAMESAGRVIEGAGGHFVDGAIMGPLGKQKHRVSTVVSGERADEVALTLQGWEMNVRSIGTDIGLASTVKMIRSVYTKGLEAVVLECMRAADEYGATELVLESLEEILRLGPFLLPFRDMVHELVVEQVDHAPRRAAEMEQVVKTLEEIGVEPKVAQSTLATLAEVARLGLREQLAGQKLTPEAVLQTLRGAGSP